MTAWWPGALVAADPSAHAEREGVRSLGSDLPNTSYLPNNEAVTSEPEQAEDSSLGLRRITGPVSIAVLAVASSGVVSGVRGQSLAVVSGAIAALLVAVVGTALVFTPRQRIARIDAAALAAVGLAGAALAGLLPNTPGYVIVYWALAGLAMRLELRPALFAGFAVIAAMNSAFWLAGGVSVSALFSQDLGAGFVFAVGAFTRSSRIAQQQAAVAQARAEDLLAQLRASQDAEAEAAALRERARLAREIHDVLAHALAGLVLALDTMELLGRQAATDPDTVERMLEQVSRGQRMARDGLADTKRAIAALRGDTLPGPALLHRLVRDTAAATGVRAELTVTGVERPLTPQMGLTLYRTAQEALTNTAKYAGQGAGVAVRLTYDHGDVELVIEDTRSEGAPRATAGLTFGGYGLTGMRERAELLGGNLTAGPTDLGFRVRLQLPADGTATRPGLADGHQP